MSQSLIEILPGKGGSGLRVWLKSSAYTTRLLLGEGRDPWVGPAQFLSYFNQAQGLLRPDVAVVEVGDLFDSWVVRHPELRDEMGSKRRLSFPLRKLLESEGPRLVLAEVVDAVIGSLRGQTPLVLAMPSPKHWLIQANQHVGRNDVELDQDSIEDAAMYVADLVRAVSTSPVGGILLEEHPNNAQMGDFDLEYFRPLINVARHYRWAIAVRPNCDRVISSPILADFDAVLSKTTYASEPVSTGVDVSDLLWSGQKPPSIGKDQFYFVEIPETQKPEFVLDSLASLRAQSN